MIILPEAAKTSFDEKANSLIAALRPTTDTSPPKPIRGSLAHKPVLQLKDADIIGPIEHIYSDSLGRFLGFEINEANVHEFLPVDAAEQLENIAYTVAMRRELRAYCGKNYVRQHLVGWVRRRRLQESADKSWTSDFLESLNKDISDQTILIPLEGIEIAFPFKIGQVDFDFFTDSFIDAMLSKLPEGTQDSEKSREPLKKLYLGRVYTKFQCRAEKDHARRLAFHQTDKALEILKLFTHAALEIRAQCFLGRMGHVNPGQYHAFQVRPNGKVLLSKGLEFLPDEFVVNEQRMHIFQHSGYSIAGQLLRKTQLTDLEEKCLEAISHYAHGVTSPSPQDRLIHAFVAVETLLLGDKQESIRSNVFPRVALLATSKLEDHKKAVRDLGRGYTLRSEFIHHGVKSVDMEIANRVLLLCWSAMSVVLGLTRKFDSKRALIDSLEDELPTHQ